MLPIKLQLRLIRARLACDPVTQQDSLINLGDFKWHTGDKESACQLFMQAQKFDIDGTSKRAEQYKQRVYQYLESQGRWKEAAAFFETAEGYPFSVDCPFGYHSSLKTYQHGMYLYAALGDKKKEAAVKERLRRSTLSLTYGLGESTQGILNFWLIQGSADLCAYRFDEARQCFKQMIDEEEAFTTQWGRCSGRIMMFVTSVVAGDMKRAETEVEPALTSLSWLRQHDQHRLGGIEETFLGQYATFLRARGQLAKAVEIEHQENELRHRKSDGLIY